ncbi:Bgt-20182, partial [Blumeria graminis f. sp. tritici]
KGQSINHDAIISFQLATNSGWSEKVTVSCGIVENGTFPGDICLGQTIYH